MNQDLDPKRGSLDYLLAEAYFAGHVDGQLGRPDLFWEWRGKTVPIPDEAPR